MTKRVATLTPVGTYADKREKDRAKSRASEKTTEIERKRIGTTSPISSSSILRKSSPKMVGCAKRVRDDEHNIILISLSSYDRESRFARNIMTVDTNGKETNRGQYLDIYSR